MTLDGDYIIMVYQYHPKTQKQWFQYAIKTGTEALILINSSDF